MTQPILFGLDESLRHTDADGRLHISWTNISKATVNPYYGREIPQYEALGLDADKIYQLWRHPDELAKAAETFNGIQLMSSHLGVDSSGAMKEQVAGALGNDAEFRSPFLGNSMTIWWKEDIEDIESGEKCQLSCGYYYDADMTPGRIDDLTYDGVMRNIRANHVALVKEGRAGPDVMVHDERLNHMTTVPLASRKAILAKGVLTAFLRPKLMAGTVLALDSALGSVNRLNWKTQKPAVKSALLLMATPKLAHDAKLDDLQLALDSLDDMEDGEEDDDMIEDEDETEEDREEKKKAASDRTGRDAKRAKDRKARDARRAKNADPDDDDEDRAEDETEEEREEKKEATDRRAKDRKVNDGKAMDAAIQKATAAVIARTNAAMEAREIVRPLVGAVSMALDSADAIYEFVLNSHGIPLAGVPKEAFKTMVGMLPKPGQGSRVLALDSAATTLGLTDRFPALARINF